MTISVGALHPDTVFVPDISAPPQSPVFDAPVPSWRVPLKALTVIHSFAPGGVERVALRLNRAMGEIGIEARVVVGRDQGMPDTGCDGADFITIPDGKGFGRRSPFLWMVRHLPAIIRRERPDVLFFPGNTYTSVAVAMKLWLGSACPPIVTKVSNDLERRDMPAPVRFLYHRWLKLQGRLIDSFVAMAPAMVPEIVARMGVPVSRVRIINDPVLRLDELESHHKLPRIAALRGRRFIAVGRLVAQKNFALLLDAFARMAGPDDRLTILGEGPEREKLEAHARVLGITDRLSMPGHVDKVYRWFANADIFCMSSDYEGVPAVLIEAIATGLPIVATECSSAMADLVGRGRFGTLVPVGSAEALARAMETQAPAGPRPSAAAIAHVRQFTIEAGARGYASVMAELAAPAQELYALA